jgi:hypothetical protein
LVWVKLVADYGGSPFIFLKILSFLHAVAEGHCGLQLHNNKLQSTEREEQAESLPLTMAVGLPGVAWAGTSVTF